MNLDPVSKNLPNPGTVKKIIPNQVSLITIIIFLGTLIITNFLLNLIFGFGSWMLGFKTKLGTCGSGNYNQSHKSNRSHESDRSHETSKSEVFNIIDSNYNYMEASTVCSLYGARLATKDEMEQAHREGANWCNLGWVQDHEAYYPTQSEQVQIAQTWPHGLSTACGQIGLNGGDYDPRTPLSVNCYGPKPPKNIHINPWNTIKNQWNNSVSKI